MQDGLLIVNVGSIVSHEHTGWSAIGLRVYELVKRIYRGQGGGASLYTVLPGQQRREIRGLDLASVLLGASKSILEVDCRGRRRRLRLGHTAESAGAKP